MKKFFSLVVISSLIAISSVQLYASEIVSGIGITSETMITSENVDGVLNYLGLDPNSLITTEQQSMEGIESIYTVGELQEILNGLSSQPYQIQCNDVIEIKDDIFSQENNQIKATNVISVSETSSIEDSFFMEYGITASYSGKSWTGVTGTSIAVDSDQLVLTYKITNSGSPKAKFDSSSLIIYTASPTVKAYVGVGDIGILPVATYNIDATVNFYARNYL